MVNIFEARPSRARAHSLRGVVNEHLCSDLRAAVAAARRVLPAQAAYAAQVLDVLDTDRRISPVVYTLQWHLSAGIRSQDAARVAAALSGLGSLHDSGDIFVDDLELSTLQWDECDRATAEYLYSAAGPRGAQGEFAEMLPVEPQPLAEYVAVVQDALAMLRAADPEMHAEMTELVAGIRIYRTRHLGSISTPRSFGLMHLKPPTSAAEMASPTVCFVERIVHETSHIALNAVMTHDPLVLNDPGTGYSSPLRPDPRPMNGIYHAVFVLSRVVRTLASVRQHHATEDVAVIYEDSLAAFEAGHDTVRAHGELSERGREVLDSCAALVAEATTVRA